MACCKIDSIHTGQVHGTIKSIHGISTYITFPPGTAPLENSKTQAWNRAMLFLSEVHGIDLPNTQLLADDLSVAMKCPVIAPDLFRGSPFPFEKPEGWNDDEELEKYQTLHHPGTVDPILQTIIEWLGQPLSAGGFGGVTNIGAIGYCFGGRYVIRLLGSGGIKAGVVNHPSFFTMQEVEDLALKEPKDDSPRTGWSPLAIFAAEEDDIFPETKRRQMEDVLKRIGATWWCSTFSHTTHGFRYVVRLDTQGLRQLTLS
jgi:dienelactone hydrolase